MRVYLYTLLLVLTCSNALAITYYEPFLCDSGESEVQRRVIPPEPFRNLSDTLADQGRSPTCAFHAVAVLLADLANSQWEKQKGDRTQNKDVDIFSLMQQLGIQKEDLAMTSGASSVALLLKSAKMANQGLLSLLPHRGITVKQVCAGCPLKGNGSLNTPNTPKEEFLNDLVDSFTVIPYEKLERIGIPPHRVRVWDFQGNEDPLQVIEKLIEYFNGSEKRPASGPMLFSSCVKEPCNTYHGIALLGIQEVECKNGVTQTVTSRYAGIFRNSWGKPDEEMNLALMLKGMIKNQLSISSIEPCGTKSQDPQHIADPHSNWIRHFAEEGDDERLKEELDHPYAGINQSGMDGITPLFVASQNGHLSTVDLLLHGFRGGEKADPNLKASNGGTPLLIAAQYGHTEIVNLLLQHGAEVNAAALVNVQSAAQVLRDMGFFKVAEQLMAEQLFMTRSLESDTLTSLIIAAMCGRREIVEILLRQPGIDIEHRFVGKTAYEWLPVESSP